MATKACELKKLTLDLVLLLIDYILALFKKLKAEFKDNPIFSLMFNLGQAKIDKYYRLSDRTPVYVAALVLYPSRKWRYIEKHQKRAQAISTKAKIKEFQEKKYKPTSNSPPLAKPPLLTNDKNTNAFFEWLNDNVNKAIQDEYERYYVLLQILGIKQGYKQWLEPT